jgi:hypothetical protein
MSINTRDTREDENDEPEPLPDDPNDGATELDQRAAFQLLFNSPLVRNYALAAFGALGMIFLILFQQGSDLGGLIIVILGTCGILFRWSSAPALILLVLTYFMLFPFGIPGEGFRNRWEIEEGRFRITDVMLVLSVLIYIASQFRIYGLTYQAMAFEGQHRRKDEPITRRPPAIIHPNELVVLLGLSVGFVIFGQLIWWFANAVDVVPAEDFPLRWIESSRMNRFDEPGSGTNTGTTRFIILTGLLFFGTLLTRLIFGYWRLRMMGSAEARMILLDGGWSETHRERTRLEKWRIWGRKRAEAQAAKTENTSTGRTK